MNWRWYLSDLDKIEKNGLKVFTCFSCGGGSSMGYKLAGCTVLGNVEIDKHMNKLYVKNHNPKYNFHMDVRKFKDIPNEDLPKELFELDILDGSPPCSSFSLAGNREKDWGKKKKFKEGQSLQTLDDLFFDFIDIAEKLQPKVVIAENVKGLITGNARGYVREIIKRYDKAGYDTQLFLLNSAKMGIGQMRERVFFISRRKDLHLPKVTMEFNQKPVTYGEVESYLKDNEKIGRPLSPGIRKWFHKVEAGKRIADYHPKKSLFSYRKVHPNKPVHTITASNDNIMHYKEPCFIPDKALIGLQSFPQDYDFMDQKVPYVCGMSVPPLMMYGVASSVVNQVFNLGGTNIGNSKVTNQSN